MGMDEDNESARKGGTLQTGVNREENNLYSKQNIFLYFYYFLL
jgi:hypothetical protein